MKNFEGYLFTKLAAIGTKSEGPVYFLQQKDYSEIQIKKIAHPWEVDPMLHQFIARKVLVTGEIQDKLIIYKKVTEKKPETIPWISLHIDVPDNILWVNKMPGPVGPALQKQVTLGLYIQWPYTTPWQGTCPTTQVYEFEILTPTGKSLWKWSKGRRYKKQVTHVALEGMIQHEIDAKWTFYDKDIPVAGTYTLMGTFIPAKVEVRKSFEVKFAV